MANLKIVKGSGAFIKINYNKVDGTITKIKDFVSSKGYLVLKKVIYFTKQKPSYWKIQQGMIVKNET